MILKNQLLVRSKFWEVAAFTLIIVLGFGLRVYHLGQLGLGWNEDYTIIAARGILEHHVPLFPSGILYPRAIPLSYIEAFLIQIFGFSEFIVRAPSVLFSTLSIGMVYLLGKKLLTPKVALLAALVMSLSDWEIIVGRTARMYSMLSFLYLLSIYLMFRITVEKQNKLRSLSLLSSILTVLTQQLGGLLALIYFAFGYFHRDKRLQRNFALFSGIFVVLMFVALTSFQKYYYAQAHERAHQSLTQAELSESVNASNTIREIVKVRYIPVFLKLKDQHPLSLVFISVFLLSALVGLVIRHFKRNDGLLFISTLVLICLALYVQQLALSAYFLLFYTLTRREHLWESHGRKIAGSSGLLFLGLLIGASGAWICIDVATAPQVVNGNLTVGTILASTTRSVIGFVPPLSALFLRKYPAMSLLFLVGTLLAAKRCWESREITEEYYLLILCFLPMAATSLHPQAMVDFKERYAFFLNPYFILLFCYGMMRITSLIGQAFYRSAYPKALQRAAVLFFCIGILLTTDGLNIKRSWAAVNMHYGANAGLANIEKTFLVYPDHKGPSLFVKDHYRDGDLVIAMDILVHYAYFPRVDYHLTRDFKGYGEGWMNAKSIRTADDFREIIQSHRGQRIWVVSSVKKLTRYRDDPEIQEIIRMSTSSSCGLVYLGRDGSSGVYLIVNRLEHTWEKRLIGSQPRQ